MCVYVFVCVFLSLFLSISLFYPLVPPSGCHFNHPTILFSNKSYLFLHFVEHFLLYLLLHILIQWTLQVSMEDQWLSQQRVGLGTEKDADVLRETLLETSPWLLGPHCCVIHSFSLIFPIFCLCCICHQLYRCCCNFYFFFLIYFGDTFSHSFSQFILHFTPLFFACLVSSCCPHDRHHHARIYVAYGLRYSRVQKRYSVLAKEEKYGRHERTEFRR